MAVKKRKTPFLSFAKPKSLSSVWSVGVLRPFSGRRKFKECRFKELSASWEGGRDGAGDVDLSTGKPVFTAKGLTVNFLTLPLLPHHSSAQWVRMCVN